MLPCATKLPQDNTSSSQTIADSVDFTQPSSFPTELKATLEGQLEKEQESLNEMTENLKPATSSMHGPAKNLMGAANTVIFAKNVTNLVTERKTARKGASEVYGLQLKYLRHNLWQEGAALSPTTAEWSEQACPLPRPPFSEVFNPIAAKTIADYPELFQINTPIKVDVFESLLEHHPNLLFVQSICAGLHEGFWPWADTKNEVFPSTHNESRPMPADNKQASFLCDQCLKERQKGCFSDSFGSKLLPGMFSMPVHAIPKPNSDDL